MSLGGYIHRTGFYPSISTRLHWRRSYLRYPSTSLSMPIWTLYHPSVIYRSSFYSNNSHNSNVDTGHPAHFNSQPEEFSKQGPLKPGLYLVGTPIGNLEDITIRALRVLRSADVILSEDTRHSGKLLQHYDIKTPLLSYHKFNESQRGQSVLKRLQGGEVVALISDAGTPCISDPGMELAMLCVKDGIDVIPIPGPSALVTALSASGLCTSEFTFVGFLPKHAGSRKNRLLISANESATQIFFVPPHKLSQFLEEISSLFGGSRRCVIAREMTKFHEELVKDYRVPLLKYLFCFCEEKTASKQSKFWRGTIDDAVTAFSTNQPKGEITFLIEGKAISLEETPSESQVEDDLRKLMSKGCSLSEAVKLVAAGITMNKKQVYSVALRIAGTQPECENCDD